MLVLKIVTFVLCDGYFKSQIFFICKDITIALPIIFCISVSESSWLLVIRENFRLFQSLIIRLDLVAVLNLMILLFGLCVLKPTVVKFAGTPTYFISTF